MSKFKKGDKVKIRKDTRYYGGDVNSTDPKDVVGTVDTVKDPHATHKIRVKWPNGLNIYEEKDLEIAETEDEIKAKEGNHLFPRIS